MSEQKEFAARAFVSCSLRPEDKPFVNMVEKILMAFNIEPFGTVGKYDASPENPIALMNKNIPLADIVVICATPRYLQQDLRTGTRSLGLSEMVHVETGMAIAHGKPIVVFVREGTNVGTILPNVTQYVTLNGEQQDLLLKRQIITSLIHNAYNFVQKMKNSNSLKTAGKVVLWGLAGYGGYKLLKEIFGTKKSRK